MSAISLDRQRIHRVLTPEGVSLPFVVAPAGDRLGAFLFDMMLIVLGTVLAWLVGLGAATLGLAELGISFAILAGFLLWNFYFIHYEIRAGGVTPGKRRAGLRVIARDGGPLTAEAVFARNLMRNLEFYIPVLALLFPEMVLSEIPGWGRLLAIVWLLTFALMPLFNQDRLRCGDLVAGTLVVKAPVAVLLSDLAERPAARPARPDRAAEEQIAFTREQLDIYGVHELQVLEDLLRRDDEGTLDGRVLEEVCEKIKTKIGWPPERWQTPARPFLESFYRAQRALLEQKMLFGQRRERKKG
ncbi:MAG: RDD family protein [Thermoanaerobaculia bacterium]